MLAHEIYPSYSPMGKPFFSKEEITEEFREIAM